jgi:hypothetical protein
MAPVWNKVARRNRQLREGAQAPRGGMATVDRSCSQERNLEDTEALENALF